MKIDSEILCSFIDGELDQWTTQQVQAAVEADPKLRAEYESLLKTAELVRDLPQVPAPSELLEQIKAHGEREQLIGPDLHSPAASPSRLYWVLSVAASLLVGIGLGVLGYDILIPQLSVAPETAKLAEPRLVADERADVERAGEGLAGIQLAGDRSRRALDMVDDNGREVAGPVDTGMAGKTDWSEEAGVLLARGGPKKGAAAKSVGAADAPAAYRDLNGQMAKSVLSSKTALGYAEKAGQAKDAKRALESNHEPAKPQPFGVQIAMNNYVNQDMAANVSLAVEPLNVKVISNDSAQTLEYVQRWAESNSLINLNASPARLNFPVYAQVVYQGGQDNVRGIPANGVLVRTTRRQARQMICELQEQKPVVVSVEVRDENKELGDVRDQLAQQQPSSLGRRLAVRDTDKRTDLEAKEQIQATVRQGERPADEGYLFYLSNQAQVSSLKDLVSIVVLVEDAVRPVEAKAGVPVAAIFSQPQRVASVLANHGYTPSRWKKTSGTDRYHSLAERQITRGTYSRVGDVPNDITYFVAGSPNYVARLRLTANVFNTEKAMPVLNEFQKLIPVLFSSLGLQTPKGLSTSIDSQQHFTAELSYGTVSFNREKYRLGYGLVLQLDVATKEGEK